MEKAEARKLQPYFIRSFFTQAFQQLGGELRPREPGRYEITHVPAIIRERDRQITGRDRRNADPVLRRYERVCFEKQYVRVLDRVGAPMASLLHPGPPADAVGDRPGARSPPQQAQARRRAGGPGRHGPDPEGDVHHRPLGQGRRRPDARGVTPHAVRRDRPQGQRHQRRLGASPGPGATGAGRHGADRGCAGRPLDRQGPGAGRAGPCLHAPRARALRRGPCPPREDTSTRRWPPSTSAWSRKSASGPTATSSCRTTSPPARMCA